MLPVKTWARYIIVVDKDIDIYNIEDVLWAMTALLLQPEQLIIFSDTPSWNYDVATLRDRRSIRIGIDATRPLPLRDKIIRASPKKVD